MTKDEAMIYSVKTCPDCGLPRLNKQWVIITATVPAGSHYEAKSYITEQGDNRAQMDLYANRIKAHGGACRVVSAEGVEKCKCK